MNSRSDLSSQDAHSKLKELEASSRSAAVAFIATVRCDVLRLRLAVHPQPPGRQAASNSSGGSGESP